MYGWHGRILVVDLTTHSFHSEQLTAERLQAVIGGRGLAVELFTEFAHLDPFSPDIPLIMTTGPLSGTGTPAAERLCLLSRSPLTETVFNTSAGGVFAHALKSSGHDGLAIFGISKNPVALRIQPDMVEFIPADTLWGKTTSETISHFSDRGVAAIGPAGENGVRYANVVFSGGDNDSRGGLGAVMGHKKLKAIAVDGDRTTSIADQPRLNRSHADIMRLFRASPAIMGPLGLHEYGTPTFVDLTNQRHMLPTRNFRESQFPLATSFSGPAIRKELNPEHASCHDCPIACKKRTELTGRLPDYSALCHFGSLLGISDLKAIIAANTTCRELGIDAISAGATLATWGEITGDFPSAGQLCSLLEQIGRRKGVGEQLADGAKHLATERNRPETAMTVKGLELPAFDPRGATGMALSFCTSSLGGSQTHANLESSEILRKPVAIDRCSFSGKARLLKIAEDAHAAYDSMIVCQNAFYAASLEEYAETLCAVTGHGYSPVDLNRCGESIIQTELAINHKNGFSIADDMLPDRFFCEPGGTSDGQHTPSLDKKLFAEELRRYYRIRGLTRDTGDNHSDGNDNHA